MYTGGEHVKFNKYSKQSLQTPFKQRYILRLVELKETL